MTAYTQALTLLERTRAGDSKSADELELMIRSYMPNPGKWDGMKFTETERRIMDRMFARPGERVSRSDLFDAIYFDKPGDKAPDLGIIGVFLNRLRKKLAGTKYYIPKENPWSAGYTGQITA